MYNVYGCLNYLYNHDLEKLWKHWCELFGLYLSFLLSIEMALVTKTSWTLIEFMAKYVYVFKIDFCLYGLCGLCDFFGLYVLHGLNGLY